MADDPFELNDGQEVFLEEVRCVGRNVILPLAAEAEGGAINRPLLEALGSSGLLGRLFPARPDGRVPAMKLCLLREGLAMECTEAETALALQGLGGYPILAFGSAGLAERWIPAIARGEAVAAFALTETGSGSDPGSLELRAQRDGKGFRLSGVKTWISNAPFADVYTLFARTKAATGSRGITAFVVPGDSAGLGGESIPMLSPHPIGRLELRDVFVPEDHVLGEVDDGFRVAMETLDLFRPSVGAFAVGMSRVALDCAIEHAVERQAFGRAIKEFQAVSHLLADMETRIRASRLLVYAAAAAFDRGGADPLSSAVAKLHATETAQFVIDSAVQILGARALAEDHILSHLYREVRATRIYEGTSEIQRSIIARELFRGRA